MDLSRRIVFLLGPQRHYHGTLVSGFPDVPNFIVTGKI